MSANISDAQYRPPVHRHEITTKLRAITSILHNLSILYSKHYLLNFAFNVGVTFDNVRRSNKPHSVSCLTQGTTLPAIKFAAMARLRNDLKTNQRSMPNGSANFIY